MLIQSQIENSQNRHIIVRYYSNSKKKNCNSISNSSSGYMKNQNHHSLEKKKSPYTITRNPVVNNSLTRNSYFQSPHSKNQQEREMYRNSKEQALQKMTVFRKALIDQKYRNEEGFALHSSEAKLYINNNTTDCQTLKYGLNSKNGQLCRESQSNSVFTRTKKYSIGSLNSDDAPNLDKLITELKLSPSLSLSSIQELSKGISDSASLDNHTDQLQKERSVRLLQKISQQLTILKEKQEKKSVYLRESQTSYLTSNISQEVQTINLLLQSIQKKLTLSKYQQSAASSNVYSHANSSSSFQNVINGSQMILHEKMRRSSKSGNILSANKQNSNKLGRQCGSSSKKGAYQVSPIKQLNEQSSSRILYTNFSLKDIDQIEKQKQNKQEQQPNFSMPFHDFSKKKKSSYTEQINLKNVNISYFNSSSKEASDEEQLRQYKNQNSVSQQFINQQHKQESKQIFESVSPFHRPKSRVKSISQLVDYPTFSFCQAKQIQIQKEKSQKGLIEYSQQEQENRKVQRLNQQIKMLQKLLKEKTEINHSDIKKKSPTTASFATPQKSKKAFDNRLLVLKHSCTKKYKKI